MPRLKRKDVLAAIRVAGYHGDQERGILLFVRNRVSRRVYNTEFNAGAAMRQSGLPCDCFDCRRAGAASRTGRLHPHTPNRGDGSSPDAGSLIA